MGFLRDALDPRAVRVAASAGDWRDVVRVSGGLLRDAGAVEDRYVEAMVRTTEELGPYAVIAPGVAIPHARPEDGAHRIALSVLTLAQPVEFGSKDNDPVEVVFGFCTTGSDVHVELLGELADFIEEERNLKALKRAETVEAVLAIVDGQEKT